MEKDETYIENVSVDHRTVENLEDIENAGILSSIKVETVTVTTDS